MRIAIVFDDRQRPETTGTYCVRALAEFVDVAHIQPDELDGLSRSSFDLFLSIDDGLRYRWPRHLRPSAWWAIDTHLAFDWCREKATDFDIIFASQRDGARQLQECGFTCQWLPLACDPGIHHPCHVPKLFNVCFVGNLFPGRRNELVEQLCHEFRDVFVGNRYFEEMAQTYSASRTVFNCSIHNDINMRVFEALACGSLLVTNDLTDNGQADLFQDGKHLATYQCTEELIDKLRFYLRHEGIRSRIETEGQSEVIAQHTYRHRMEAIVAQMNSYREQTTVAVTKPSPPQSRELPLLSACLVSWRRPKNIRNIVAHLRTFPFIDDIVVWHNNPDQPLELDRTDVRVLAAERNYITYGRYLATAFARHDFVYTQDDDCLVHNIEAIYRRFLENPDVICHALKPPHMQRQHERDFGHARMALVGWGAVFDRRWTDTFETYLQEHGEDDLLLREADRIFSILLARLHEPILTEVTDLPGNSGAEAISVHPRHAELVNSAVKRSLGLLASTSQTRKEEQYFAFARPEIMALVPPSARRILDIGCGVGRLGKALKERLGAHLTGIELDALAAAKAAECLDEVISCNVESENVQFEPATFDCVICGDVLEHLLRPDRVLERLRSWLTPSGTLVASIPNAQHHSLVGTLLAGNWTYERAGLLDETHRQFLTRADIVDLFEAAGFSIDSISMVPGPQFQEWNNQGCPLVIRIGGLQTTCADVDEASQFFAYQYLVTARSLSKTKSKHLTDHESIAMSITDSYFIKPGYTIRANPRRNMPVREAEMVYQPDVYRLAVQLGRWRQLNTVVDLGCGCASKLRAIATHFKTLVAVDVASVVESGRAVWPEAHWVAHDLEGDDKLCLPDVSLSKSVVVCADVIEHLQNPMVLLKKLRLLLNEAPTILVSTPERDLVRGPHHMGPPDNLAHVREWNLKEFMLLLRHANLPIAHIGLTASNERERTMTTILAILTNEADEIDLLRMRL